MTSQTLSPTAPSVGHPTVAAALPTVPLAAAAGVLLLRPALIALGAGALRLASISPVYLNAVIVAIDLVTLAAVALVLRRHGRRLRDLLGPVRGFREIGWSLLTFVVVVIAFVVATYAGNLVVYQGPPPTSGTAPTVPLWLGLVSLLVMPVTVALAEELVYRGLGQWSLGGATTPVVGLVVTAVCFGLQHVPMSLETPQAALARFVTTFLLGLGLGGLVLWQRRLVPLVVAHWALDVVGLGLPMLALALAGAR